MNTAIKSVSFLLVGLIVTTLGPHAVASPLSDLLLTQAHNQAIQMKVINYDMATVYGNDPTIGTTSTDPDTWAAGQSATLGGVGSEDGWGIFIITQIIKTTDPLNPIYTRADSGETSELVGIFYGLHDDYVEQTAATENYIASSGATFDIYEQAKGTVDPTLGSGGRIGASGYTTISNTGTLVLSANSIPGFLRTAGDKNGVATEVENIFNNNSNSGHGSTYLDIIAGSGDLAEVLNSNSIFSPASIINGAPNADLHLEFTTQANVGVGDWLINSNDPVSGKLIPLPGASSMGLGLMGVLALGRKRRMVG